MTTPLEQGPRTVVTTSELPAMVGSTVGPSPWLAVTQEMVDTFADATGDHQWIHVDPERARTGPFGGTIAHGFLSLSLVIPLWTQLFDVSDVRTKVNYGLDRVRFTAPVPVGSRIRLTATLESVDEVPGGVQLTTAGRIDLEGSERPAVVLTLIGRFYH